MVAVRVGTLVVELPPLGDDTAHVSAVSANAGEGSASVIVLVVKSRRVPNTRVFDSCVGGLLVLSPSSSAGSSTA
jgi:hypothetical protein